MSPGNKGARQACARLALGGVLGVVSQTAVAGHGFNLIGFGAESVGMAGADMALSRDTAAINLNPAGLTQLGGRAFDIYLNPFHTLGLSHSDSFGNRRVKNDIPAGATGGASYAQRLRPDLVVGLGTFVQGGTGYAYEDLQTAFGTEDELSLVFGVSKFVIGAGWSVHPQLSLGASLGVSYAQGRQKFFYETSVPEAGFFGLRFDGGQALEPNFKLGLQYRPTDTLTLALVYNSKTALDLDDATLTVNYEGLDLGRVKYRDAELEGFALPQELGAGLAWRANPRLLIAFDANWLDYAGALDETRLRGRDPNRADLPENLRNIELVTPLDWSGQYALALGAAWRYDNKTVLRAGFDRVNNPIPRETMSPLVNLIQKEEITLGFGRQLDQHWQMDFTLQYQWQREVTYTNPSLPFGPGATEDYEIIAVILSIGRRW